MASGVKENQFSQGPDHGARGGRGRHWGPRNRGDRGGRGRGARRVENQALYFAERTREMEEREARYREERERVERGVATAQLNNTITEERFHVVHFNILTRTDEARYLPCELGLVRFSLSQGIEAELHRFLYPPEIPIGYTFIVKDIAEKTHQLDWDSPPLVSLRTRVGEDVSSLYRDLVKDLRSFLNPTGQKMSQLPPLYTVKADIEKTVHILRDLVRSSDMTGTEEEEDMFRVYDLDHLLYSVCTNTPRGNSICDPILAQDLLEQDVYQYLPGLACQYHDTRDQPRFCSLFTAKRWMYITCEKSCPNYDIELVKGRQQPERPEIVPVETIAEVEDEWVPSFAVAEASRRSRYLETVPTNEYGAAKSRSQAAGVVINENRDWTPLVGSSRHAFVSDRKLLEQQQCLGTPIPPLTLHSQNPDYYQQQDQQRPHSAKNSNAAPATSTKAAPLSTRMGRPRASSPAADFAPSFPVPPLSPPPDFTRENFPVLPVAAAAAAAATTTTTNQPPASWRGRGNGSQDGHWPPTPVRDPGRPVGRGRAVTTGHRPPPAAGGGGGARPNAGVGRGRGGARIGLLWEDGPTVGRGRSANSKTRGFFTPR